MNSRKPYFLISDHAIERRDATQKKCFEELKYLSKEIDERLARPLLGRAGLKSRKFTGSRYWVVNDEWMYISQPGRYPDVQIITTCIHLWDKARQAVLRGESITLIKAEEVKTAKRQLPTTRVDFSSELREEFLSSTSVCMMGEDEAKEELKICMNEVFDDWKGTGSEFLSSSKIHGKLVCKVSKDGQTLHVSYMDTGASLPNADWRVKLGPSIVRLFPDNDNQRIIKELILEAYKEEKSSVEVEFESNDQSFEIRFYSDEDSMIIYSGINQNTNDLINWVTLAEIE
jgi:hypothetical protein